jgi:hypothetical protein
MNSKPQFISLFHPGLKKKLPWDRIYKVLDSNITWIS